MTVLNIDDYRQQSGALALQTRLEEVVHDILCLYAKDEPAARSIYLSINDAGNTLKGLCGQMSEVSKVNGVFN